MNRRDLFKGILGIVAVSATTPLSEISKVLSPTAGERLARRYEFTEYYRKEVLDMLKKQTSISFDRHTPIPFSGGKTIQFYTYGLEPRKNA
jgi:hypothetical protein